MVTFIQDVRHSIARKPTAAAVVVLSLALGVGANATIFSLINALLLRPPAVEKPEHLADVYQHVKTRGSGVGAFAVTRELSSILCGIHTIDSVTFASVSLLLTGVAFLARSIPARRAARVSPIVALRYE
jgi:ABC-type antimicrobial peptide transport system permease subunit